MPFVIKWIPQDASATVVDRHVFERLRDALEHAGAVLGERPTDVWIEDEAGQRVAYQDRIVEYERRRIRPDRK